MLIAATPEYNDFMARTHSVNSNPSTSAFHHAWYQPLQGNAVTSQSVVRWWKRVSEDAVHIGLLTADGVSFLDDLFPSYVVALWGDTNPDFAAEVIDIFNQMS